MDISDGELNIKNYNLYRVDSDSRHTGGVSSHICEERNNNN